MRVLFTSDLQLEAGQQFGRGEFGLESRFQDQALLLGQVSDIVVAQNVKLVCVLGDVFDRPKPSPWAILLFQAFVRRCSENGAHVLCLLGNHDVKSAALPPALSIFKEQKVQVALMPSLYPFGECVIAAMPWTPISRLVADTQIRDRDELLALASNSLLSGCALFAERCAVEYEGLPAILVGHWGITGAALPSGLGTDTLREPLLSLDTLRSLPFELIGFGHIHKPQILCSSPPVFFCGSPYVVNWGETEFAHGAWIYDTVAKRLGFEELKDREFVTINLNTSDLGDWNVPEGSLVRVRYEATPEEARQISKQAIQTQLLGQGARSVIVQPTIVRPERVRSEVQVEQLSYEQAFDLWLEAHPEEGEDLEALRALHSHYMEQAR